MCKKAHCDDENGPKDGILIDRQQMKCQTRHMATTTLILWEAEWLTDSRSEPRDSVS
jgi:hypothetical protein